MIMTEISKEHCDNCNNEVCCCILKTRETLEEAAEHFFNNTRCRNYKTFFCEGAKWQQERMYSEEEVIELTNWYLDTFLDDALGLNGKDAAKKVEHLKGKGLTKEVMEYWFEQFKKK